MFQQMLSSVLSLPNDDEEEEEEEEEHKKEESGQENQESINPNEDENGNRLDNEM
jgi:hypothetical protein